MFKKNQKYYDGTDFVTTANYANPKLWYYYFIPEFVYNNPNEMYNCLVCVPGLYTQGGMFVNKEFRNFALENNIIIIAPTFIWDKVNWSTYSSYQYPYYWSGEAFMSILEKEHSRGFRFKKLLLYGFSAGAQFVLRFSLLKPNYCHACAAHASGGIIKPHEYKSIKYFISVGTKDHDRYNNAAIFVNRANLLKIDTTFNVYEAGHRQTKKQLQDTLNFFQKNLI